MTILLILLDLPFKVHLLPSLSFGQSPGNIAQSLYGSFLQERKPDTYQPWSSWDKQRCSPKMVWWVLWARNGWEDFCDPLLVLTLSSFRRSKYSILSHHLRAAERLRPRHTSTLRQILPLILPLYFLPLRQALLLQMKFTWGLEPKNYSILETKLHSREGLPDEKQLSSITLLIIFSFWKPFP